MATAQPLQHLEVLERGSFSQIQDSFHFNDWDIWNSMTMLTYPATRAALRHELDLIFYKAYSHTPDTYSTPPIHYSCPFSFNFCFEDMHTPTRLRVLYLLAVLVPDVLSQCASYGSDYVDGGTYCINTQSPDYFSFGTFFTGCQPSDSQGNITPILVDPNNNEYFCSDIPTTPDNTVYKSTWYVYHIIKIRVDMLHV